MAAVLSKVKQRITSPKGSCSPAGMEERMDPKGRGIPPEPVQQQPNGDLTSAEAEPALRAHNLARANRMVGKLDWDERLAHAAETYAKTLASTEQLEHSGIETEGENLYMSSNPDATFEEAISSWLGEEKDYHADKISKEDLQKTGHFTQCLWHSTTHVGMGKATSRNGKTYIVARYYPRGNVEGGRPY